ncbi:hypothetical protein KAS31_04545 [Candidatus Parcubacteria bacterium]|nr:hypothetical protein [Candidatus Parcubacteria bacterium]
MEEDCEREDVFLEIDRLMDDPKFEKANKEVRDSFLLSIFASTIIIISSICLILNFQNYYFPLSVATIIALMTVIFVTALRMKRFCSPELKKELENLEYLKNKVVENRSTETKIILHKAD